MEQTRNCGNNGFDMYNIGDRCEYVQYAIEIERTLHNMQKELNTCIDPRKAAMLIMRVATEFYDADWCGILDVDMEIGVWTPIWWYDTEFGEMAQTKFEEFELSEKYGRWIQCLRDHEPIIVPDVEAIKEDMPDEYIIPIEPMITKLQSRLCLRDWGYRIYLAETANLHQKKKNSGCCSTGYM